MPSGGNRMTSPTASPLDQIVFAGDLVCIGAFRCDPQHPLFHNTGPASNCCFVFPRTAVEIQHEHEPAFVANPNVVTFYNAGQAYRRNPISPEGDNCDWFGIDETLLRDVMRGFDPRVDDRAERPFARTRGFSDAPTYLLQRELFNRVAAGGAVDGLAIEEAVIELLERAVCNAYGVRVPARGEVTWAQRGKVRDVERILSRRPEERIRLTDIGREVGWSAYHLCRQFRCITGTRLHQYRLQLRLRRALGEVLDSSRPLTDLALDHGFSSHSHFTEAFRREFGLTPSAMRRVRPRWSNFSIARRQRV